jgi:hypothetical protein
MRILGDPDADPDPYKNFHELLECKKFIFSYFSYYDKYLLIKIKLLAKKLFYSNCILLQPLFQSAQGKEGKDSEGPKTSGSSGSRC